LIDTRKRGGKSAAEQKFARCLVFAYVSSEEEACKFCKNLKVKDKICASGKTYVIHIFENSANAPFDVV